jgi:undecaprenyl diphosphate synthase
VAVIMDGHGRWAEQRGLPRVAGHQAGARAVRAVVGAALGASRHIGTLTLYAFSADNWHRPVGEVCALMQLFERFLRVEAARAERESIRVSVIGRRDRLSDPLSRTVAAIERRTQGGSRLHVRLAVDYSGREAIWLAACRAVAEGNPSREHFEACVASGRGEPATVPPVDLLVRTGGEQRLSDFLLWESAYAELAFLPVLWPDFTEADFTRALDTYAARDRRFGRVTAARRM